MNYLGHGTGFPAYWVVTTPGLTVPATFFPVAMSLLACSRLHKKIRNYSLSGTITASAGGIVSGDTVVSDTVPGGALVPAPSSSDPAPTSVLDLYADAARKIRVTPFVWRNSSGQFGLTMLGSIYKQDESTYWPRIDASVLIGATSADSNGSLLIAQTRADDWSIYLETDPNFDSAGETTLTIDGHSVPLYWRKFLRGEASASISALSLTAIEFWP